MPRLLTVYTKNGAVVGNYRLANAAKLLDVQISDLAWAIEQYGRCDGDDAVALPWGEPFVKFDDWAEKHYHGKE